MEAPQILATVASVPTIVALVNLAKRFGVKGAWSAGLAAVLGIAINVAVWAWGDNPGFQAAAAGLLMGLAASGSHDLAARRTPRTEVVADVDGAPPVEALSGSQAEAEALYGARA